jgi:hypothetical protein
MEMRGDGRVREGVGNEAVEIMWEREKGSETNT